MQLTNSVDPSCTRKPVCQTYVSDAYSRHVSLFIPILSVLIEQNRSIWLMCLLALNAFIWPTLAWYRARNSAMPLVTEHQNLVLDAGAGDSGSP